MNKPIFIAEVKTQSPFGFKSKESWDELFELACAHGDWIAVHTDPRWGGSFELLKRARKLQPNLTILAKGIHARDSDIDRAWDCGANYCLTVGRVSEDYIDRTIFEPINFEQMYLPMYVYPELKVMWNARDIVTGKQKKETVTDARTNFKGWLCKASYIIHPQDIYVRDDIDAFIVGTNLRPFIEEKVKLANSLK